MRRLRRVALGVAAATLAIAAPGGAARADSIRDREWINTALDLGQAHRYTEGQGVVVAVIDTGVDATHADLAGNVLPGADISVDGIASGNGHDDRAGHGTGIAGLIAGHGHGANQTDGVLGVAPEAKILPVKDGDVLGVGLVGALRWATAHGADVICLAQGEAAGDSDLGEAITAAEGANIVLVAAAGNLPNARAVAYPAAYPGVVAAAGTNKQGNHAAVSVTGPEVVLAAPATDVVQPYPGHRYATGTGTSVSTAVIAGAAALIRARFPHLSAAEVVHRLEATAIDKGPPGRDNEYGYGLINIVSALTAKVPAAKPNSTASQVPAEATASPDMPSTSAAARAGTERNTTVGLVAALAALLATLAIWLVARRGRRR